MQYCFKGLKFLRLKGMRCRACNQKHYHPALNSSGSLNPQYRETTSQYFQVDPEHGNLQVHLEQTSLAGCTFGSDLDSTFPPSSPILLQQGNFVRIHDSLKLFARCSLADASLHSFYVEQTFQSNFWLAKPRMVSCCSHIAEDDFAFFQTYSLNSFQHHKGKIARLWLPRTGAHYLYLRRYLTCRVVVPR